MAIQEAPSFEAGHRLAQRHDEGATATYDPSVSILNYAELSRVGDWTLRSALCRLAQPHPAHCAALLDVMRRLDAPLHHVRSRLEGHVVSCDRALDGVGFAPEPSAAYSDVRTADLARLVAAGAEVEPLLAGYDDQKELEPEERVAVPLLALGVRLDAIADELTAWADAGPENPPVELVEEVAASVQRQLDELGVPVETGPPPGARRGRSRG